MKIILLLFITFNLFASTHSNLLKYYKNEQYKKACHYGMQKFNSFINDEKMLSLYAFSCLKSDYIDRLSTPMALLKKTEESRANSAYLSTIFMQKKLLYHALVDNYDLSAVTLPSTDFLLSKVFELYTHKHYTKEHNNYYLSHPENAHESYKLYLIKIRKIHKIVIEVYYDKILSEKHIYR